MTLNPDLVRERCQEITDSLARLARFQEIPRDEFLEDQDALDIACYRLLVAIEAALGVFAERRRQRARESIRVIPVWCSLLSAAQQLDKSPYRHSVLDVRLVRALPGDASASDGDHERTVIESGEALCLGPP